MQQSFDLASLVCISVRPALCFATFDKWPIVRVRNIGDALRIQKLACIGISGAKRILATTTLEIILDTFRHLCGK